MGPPICKYVRRSHFVLFPGSVTRPVVSSAFFDNDGDAAAASAIPHAASPTAASVTDVDNVPLASKKVVTLPKRVNKNAHPTDAIVKASGVAGGCGQRISGTGIGQGLVANAASAAPDAGRSHQTTTNDSDRSTAAPSTGRKPTKQHEVQRKTHANNSDSDSASELSDIGSDSSGNDLSESGSLGSDYESDTTSSSSDDDREDPMSEDSEVKFLVLCLLHLQVLTTTTTL